MKTIYDYLAYQDLTTDLQLVFDHCAKHLGDELETVLPEIKGIDKQELGIALVKALLKGVSGMPLSIPSVKSLNSTVNKFLVENKNLYTQKELAIILNVSKFTLQKKLQDLKPYKLSK